LQTRLLRVLSTGEFYRVGGIAPIKVDVRVIAATHQNLETLVNEGRFREDLYHRLNVIRIRIPTLNERREDVPLLLRHFLKRASEELSTEVKRLQPEVMTRLTEYHWPGNVRQLENVCRWLTVMAPGLDVHLSDLPVEIQTAAAPVAPAPASVPMADAPTATTATAAGSETDAPLTAPTAGADHWDSLLRQWAEAQLSSGRDDLVNEATERLERALINVALHATRGQRQEAAKRLGWGRNTLTRKIKELDME
jgi:two-component system nitrogen regulation response regulator GlnG